ncbi:MAG: hypothetical protein WC370_05395 [Dehalococcoidales bacterium]|jgi:hypothetical protein
MEIKLSTKAKIIKLAFGLLMITAISLLTYLTFLLVGLLVISLIWLSISLIALVLIIVVGIAPSPPAIPYKGNTTQGNDSPYPTRCWGIKLSTDGIGTW